MNWFYSLPKAPVALLVVGMMFTSQAIAVVQLNVNSTGASGVVITSNNGLDGTTNYIKYGIPDNTVANLQAPLTSGGMNFYNWLGCTSTSGPWGSTCSIIMEYNWQVIAEYGPDYRLDVHSSGASNVTIASTTGQGGITDYSILVNAGSYPILIAPLDVGDFVFDHWTGCTYYSGGSTGCMIGMSSNKSVTAYYIPAPPVDDFVTTWKTDNPGTSSDTSVTVPMVGGPYIVDWENDGVFDKFVYADSDTHDYGVAGTYTIRIRGAFDSIQFNNGGDKLKILSLDQWGTRPWTTMERAFYGAQNLTVPATDTPDFSLVTDMSYMFFEALSANPDTSGWDTSSVTTMLSMFYNAWLANPDTSGWDTSSVTQMWSMFMYAGSANPDTSGWDTSSVTDMSYMFHAATSANPDTSGWDTSAVTLMQSTFGHATSANPDTSGWNTANVTRMSSMFYGATSANPDTSGWNTVAVTHMSNMFSGATSFDQDIGSWDVTALLNATNMFTGVTLSSANYESLLIGWDAQALQPGVNFSGGNSTFCSATAIAARDHMIASDSWTIADGGQVCPPVETCDVNIVSGVTEYFDETHEACEILVLGPDFIVAEGANVSVNSGWEIHFMPGFLVEPGSTLNASVCGQSLCMINAFPMPYGCHSCVDQICDIDPSCCALEFDQACLDKVDTVCGLVCE